MNKAYLMEQINKIDQQMEELEQAQMFVKKSIPLYEELNDGYTTPKSKKSSNSNSNFGSEYPTTPSGDYSGGYQQNIFNAPIKEYTFPDYMYESPKFTTSLKFKLINNTYTYFDEAEIEQQNQLKKMQEEQKKLQEKNFYLEYYEKEQPEQEDLRIILGLPIFEKED